MKATINFSKLFIIIFLIFYNFSFAQGGQVITITLNVNTGEIEKQNVNEYCDFGQQDGTSNENFTISARIGDTIVWEGISTSSGDDLVNITSINHRGGNNVFNKNVLNGNNETPEKVVGTVMYSTSKGNNNKDYKYTIKFTILNNGKKRNGTFQIDPKLRVPK